MVNIYQKGAFVAIGAALSFAALETHPVQAATFSFFLVEQRDFLPVQGRFTGADLNSNNALTQNELTEFEAIFLGNDSLPAFQHTLENLVSFSFDVNNFTNFEFRSTWALDETTIVQTTSDDGNEFISGQGVAVAKGKSSAGTSELFTVVKLPDTTGVPEPTPVLSLGILGLGFLLKRKASLD
jgi:hypothetical protein